MMHHLLAHRRVLALVLVKALPVEASIIVVVGVVGIVRLLPSILVVVSIALPLLVSMATIVRLVSSLLTAIWKIEVFERIDESLEVELAYVSLRHVLLFLLVQVSLLVELLFHLSYARFLGLAIVDVELLPIEESLAALIFGKLSTVSVFEANEGSTRLWDDLDRLDDPELHEEVAHLVLGGVMVYPFHIEIHVLD